MGLVQGLTLAALLMFLVVMAGAVPNAPAVPPPDDLLDDIPLGGLDAPDFEPPPPVNQAATPEVLATPEVPATRSLVPGTSPESSPDDFDQGTGINITVSWNGVQQPVGHPCAGWGVPNKPSRIIDGVMHVGDSYRASGTLGFILLEASWGDDGHLLLEGRTRQIQPVGTGAELALFLSQPPPGGPQEVVDSPPMPHHTHADTAPEPLRKFALDAMLVQSSSDGDPSAQFQIELRLPPGPGFAAFDLHAHAILSFESGQSITSADCITVIIVRWPGGGVVVTDDVPAMAQLLFPKVSLG